MIRIELGGRVRLHEGPAARLEVDTYYDVSAGVQRLARLPRPFGTVRVIEMAPGVTYNVLKPEARGPSMTRFIVATVMLDSDGIAWEGLPTNRRRVRSGDVTSWTRILDDELSEP